MKLPASQSKEAHNTGSANANKHAPAQPDKIQPGPTAKKMLREMANNSPQVKQLRALQRMADSSRSVVQRFAIGAYEEYNGYLAGDHEIRNPENVAPFVNMLKQGKKIPNFEPMTAAKDLEMVKEEGKGWQYISKAEYDKTKQVGAKEPEVVKKNVLLDGHHRFVAYAEAGAELPAIGDAAEGTVSHGYHWSKVGKIK